MCRLRLCVALCMCVGKAVPRLSRGVGLFVIFPAQRSEQIDRTDLPVHWSK